MNTCSPEQDTGGAHADWRKDLQASRDVPPSQVRGFTLIIEWFESWRIERDRAVDPESAFEFWRTRVKAKPREDWQLGPVGGRPALVSALGEALRKRRSETERRSGAHEGGCPFRRHPSRTGFEHAPDLRALGGAFRSLCRNGATSDGPGHGARFPGRLGQGAPVQLRHATADAQRVGLFSSGFIEVKRSGVPASEAWNA